MSHPQAGRPFTGRHMLAIMLLFFGVIIAVNLTMAYMARTSWTGLVVQNSYVASQEFNDHVARARQQAALGWQAELAFDNGVFSLGLTDAGGKPIDLAGATAIFRRAASDAQDKTVTLTRMTKGRAEAPVALGNGLWIVEILASAGLDDPYRVVRRVVIIDGRLQ